MATFITWLTSLVSTHVQCKQENDKHTTHTEDFCLRHDKAFFGSKYCCHLLIVVALYCKCSLKENKRKHRPYDWQGLHSHSFWSHSCCLLLLALAPGVWQDFFIFFWVEWLPYLSLSFTVLADHFLHLNLLNRLVGLPCGILLSNETTEWPAKFEKSRP